jgi:hypothetical protein
MRIKAHRILGVLLAAILAGAAMAAATPTVVAQLEPEDIYVGESAILTVAVKNASEAATLDLSALKEDFDVALAGGPSTQSLQQFDGRQWTQESSTAWQYRLTPKHSGDLVVKAPVAQVGTKRIAGNQTALKVQEIPKQDLVLAEVSVPQKTYRMPFDVTLRVLVKPLPDGSARDPVSVLNENPNLQIEWVNTPEGVTAGDASEWLNKYITSTRRGFTINNLSGGFFEAAVFSLYTGRETRKGLDGKEINYYVYELKRRFTPQRTGKIEFGRAIVKGGFADRIENGQMRGRRLVVPTAPVIVEVRDVPEQHPENFIGGLGKFNVTASATPESLRVGDPLTLKLSVERQPGAGGLDSISAPDLSKNEALAADFDVIDKAPTGEAHGETKTFSYGLRPKRAGVNIPALTMSVFDTATEQFKEVSTAPVSLKVTAASQLKTDEIVSAVPAATPRGLKNVEGGIYQNVTDLKELGDQRVNPMAYAGMAGGLAIAYAGIAFAVIRKRRLAGDERWQRRQRAWPAASAALEQTRSIKGGDSGRAVRTAVTGLIGDMLNLPAAGMTAREAAKALETAGVGEPLRKQTESLLEQIDALEYSGGGSADGLIASAEALLPQLRRELEARA